MRIEFWVDYLCPLTFLTHQNLLAALKELGLENNEIFYRSYIIDEETFKTLNENEELMKIVDENFPNHEEFKHFHTKRVHQLAHLAKWHNLAKEFTTEVFKRKYIDNIEINDDAVLLDICETIGLDVKEAQNVLETCCYSKQIDNNKLNAKTRGIEQIPHLRINVRNNFNGYFTKEQLVKHITNIIVNKPKVPTECSGEVCEY